MWIDPSQQMFLQIESAGRAINIGFHHFLSLSATRARFAYVRNGLKHKFIRGYVRRWGRGHDRRRFAPNYDRFEPREIVQNRLSFCVSMPFRSVACAIRRCNFPRQGGWNKRRCCNLTSAKLYKIPRRDVFCVRVYAASLSLSLCVFRLIP